MSAAGKWQSAPMESLAFFRPGSSIQQLRRQRLLMMFFGIIGFSGPDWARSMRLFSLIAAYMWAEASGSRAEDPLTTSRGGMERVGLLWVKAWMIRYEASRSRVTTYTSAVIYSVQVEWKPAPLRNGTAQAGRLWALASP